MRVRVLEDAAAVAREAAQLVAADVRDGARTLVLAGGSTPRSAYELLAAMDLEWGRVLILFGDERCLPPTDPESNYAMAKGALLDKIAPAGVLRIAAELGPEVAASDYDRLLQDLGPLDLVLLGMGEDGHCASLFPDSRQLQSTALVAPVRGAPKPPAERVTLTLRALNEARRVVFMVTGQGKAAALQRARRAEVPAGRIAGAEFLVDRAAAGAQ
ncbi:MAG: 6-phosphogluconolactonase [Candidatus Dormibacteraceae bacterium]